MQAFDRQSDGGSAGENDTSFGQELHSFMAKMIEVSKIGDVTPCARCLKRTDSVAHPDAEDNHQPGKNARMRLTSRNAGSFASGLTTRKSISSDVTSSHRFSTIQPRLVWFRKSHSEYGARLDESSSTTGSGRSQRGAHLPVFFQVGVDAKCAPRGWKHVIQNTHFILAQFDFIKRRQRTVFVDESF